MAEFHLYRQTTTDQSTIGYLAVGSEVVWTLEDPKRKHKVYGETRIPAGRYKLKLRKEGGMHQRYSQRFPDMHQGMIWLQDVPMFEWVYIHIGNTPADTEGCILVGMTRGENVIHQSAMAYETIYPRIVKALQNGCSCLVIHDE